MRTPMASIGFFINDFNGIDLLCPQKEKKALKLYKNYPIRLLCYFGVYYEIRYRLLTKER